MRLPQKVLREVMGKLLIRFLMVARLQAEKASYFRVDITYIIGYTTDYIGELCWNIFLEIRTQKKY